MATVVNPILPQHVLANKQQSRISIAFIGPYAWLPKLSFNGSMVIGGMENISPSYFTDFSNPSAAVYLYWYDVAASLAVRDLNNNPDILPNTTITIKRFNTYDPKKSKNGAPTNIFVNSAGYAMNTIINQLYQDNEDVVAVFGDVLLSAIRFTASLYSYYQLPSCNPAAYSYPLLDRNLYGYTFQLDTMVGMGNALFLLLEAWNVKRIAFIYNMKDAASRAVSNDMISYIRSNGVEVLTVLDLNLGTTGTGLEFIATSLERVDARYIYVYGGPILTGNVYFGLARLVLVLT
ncbi:periplasmic binding protein-like I [Rhizoclosmatium globosum]|uniref:Periplasmic binding protein-like I n=1 Tax=Rhizoclosmatium globosum TaxID=329046 RepID=A0A1Y2CP36_9FUNG|nr:periplasmic binding protein-like I [Rhizoclosmatium globosum]|eukprot:ORY48604.1 periplasmic binding protein-like I [Rhizoclosmatium globosum]